MITQIQHNIRTVKEQDRSKIANLIHFELTVHRSLDWKTPLDWIGEEPYLIYEQGQKILATLACPPDPPEIAWIRLFAVHSSISVREAWQRLWHSALESLRTRREIQIIAAIPMQSWFKELLLREHFENQHNIIMLSWDGKQLPPNNLETNLNLRPMNYDDLYMVEDIDHRAFSTLWRNSYQALEIAYRQASLASVIEYEGRIIGYQISTSNPMGGHLARLAVDPLFQSKGAGYALVHDLMVYFKQRGANQVTVNTQSDNTKSIHLYQKMGFKNTGEIIPVFQMTI